MAVGHDVGEPLQYSFEQVPARINRLNIDGKVVFMFVTPGLWLFPVLAVSTSPRPGVPILQVKLHVKRDCWDWGQDRDRDWGQDRDARIFCPSRRSPSTKQTICQPRALGLLCSAIRQPWLGRLRANRSL